MLFVILGGIIALVCYIKGLSFKDWVDIPLGFLYTLLGGAIGALLALLVTVGAWSIEPVIDYTLVDTQEIHALEDNIISPHAHYISSGVKNGEAAYFYIVDDEWGRQVLSKNTDNSFIKYDNDWISIPSGTILDTNGNLIIPNSEYGLPPKEDIPLHAYARASQNERRNPLR